MTEEITAGGITVRIPNAAKVLFPDDGITKEDLARYYADVAGTHRRPWDGFAHAGSGLAKASARLAELSR